MPQEGNIQVVTFSKELTSPDFRSAAIEVGARGEAVELLGVHYFLETILTAGTFNVGLSSNPEHVLNPPATTDLFLFDPAIYGKSGWQKLNVNESETRVIPLYGLIRPRRQIIVWAWESASIVAILTIEVYYRPVQLSKTDLDTLNLKYGKYRRHF